MKIKKGDNIKVIAGKDKGKTGKVFRAFPKADKVIIEGMNIAKRHQRPRKEGQQGQVIDKAMPMHVSNVMIIDPKTSKPTRVGYTQVKGKNARIARGSGASLD